MIGQSKSVSTDKRIVLGQFRVLDFVILVGCGNVTYDTLTNANEQLLLANGSLTVTIFSG